MDFWGASPYASAGTVTRKALVCYFANRTQWYTPAQTDALKQQCHCPYRLPNAVMPLPQLTPQCRRQSEGGQRVVGRRAGVGVKNQVMSDPDSFSQAAEVPPQEVVWV